VVLLLLGQAVHEGEPDAEVQTNPPVHELCDAHSWQEPTVLHTSMVRPVVSHPVALSVEQPLPMATVPVSGGQTVPELDDEDAAALDDAAVPLLELAVGPAEPELDDAADAVLDADEVEVATLVVPELVLEEVDVTVFMLAVLPEPDVPEPEVPELAAVEEAPDVFDAPVLFDAVALFDAPVLLEAFDPDAVALALLLCAPELPPADPVTVPDELAPEPEAEPLELAPEPEPALLLCDAVLPEEALWPVVAAAVVPEDPAPPTAFLPLHPTAARANAPTAIS
jgi:hypothetical protein